MHGPNDASTPNGPDGYVNANVPAFRANKTYVCPECGNTIPNGEGHVVAWPQDTPDARRHWHHHCWRLAVRRRRIA